MQKILLLAVFMMMGQLIYSQQPNYLYIDAEKGQPFYVKMGEKVYSSSGHGYVLISKLTEDAYSLNIGFPQDIYPEQLFRINMNKEDQGFQLKNNDSQGWELNNLKTGVVIPSSTKAKTGMDSGQVMKTDAFSILLSKVVNDPAVLIETPVIKDNTGGITAVAEVTPITETVVMDSAKAIERPEEAIVSVTDTLTKQSATSIMPSDSSITDSSPVETIVLQEIIKLDQPDISENPAPVKRLFERKWEKLYEAGYIDKSGDLNDTIQISFPINMEDSLTQDLSGNENDSSVKEETFKKVEKSAIIIINSDCRSFAEETDVDKIRVKILAEKTMEEKLAAARKYFKLKCFTVKQIRALTELFSTDDERYHFYDAAYPFISDTHNFASLEENLNDPYYKNRFKAMIRN